MSTHSFQMGLPDDQQTGRSLQVGYDNHLPSASASGVRITNTSPSRYYGDGRAESLAGTSVNMADTSNGEKGILGTARAYDGGRAVPVAELKPNSRVTLPDGSETTVQVAERLGFLRRDEYTGRYAEVEQEKPKAAPQPTERDPNGEDIAFRNTEAEARFSALARATAQSPGDQMKAILELSETGTVSDATVNRLASVAGVEPGQMHGNLMDMARNFQEQADTHIQSLGTEAQAFYEWAREVKPNDLKAAMRQHATARQPGAYNALVQAYHMDLERHDPDSILEAQFGGGITARKSGNSVVLSIPGRGEMAYGAAVKAGVIRVSKGARR